MSNLPILYRALQAWGKLPPYRPVDVVRIRAALLSVLGTEHPVAEITGEQMDAIAAAAGAIEPVMCYAALRQAQAKAGARLGQELREVRKSRGQTQAQAAEIMGVSGNTVALWERGEQIPTGLSRKALQDYLSLC